MGSSSPPRTRFSLADADQALDPRTHAARGDLADWELAGRVFSPWFAKPHEMSVIVGVADLRGAPSRDARLGSQLLRGESFAELESEGGWSWGYGVHDHYVGYIETDALGDASEPTHVVAVRLAPIYAEPDERAAPIGDRSIGECVTATPGETFLAVEGGYLRAEDALPIGERFADPVLIAERLLGTPYLWGGRSGFGIDCSGLVQLAHAFAGIAAPRDSDQQQRALGAPLAEDEQPRRGDIVFFPDHVGMMADAETLLHATHHHGATVVEPLADVVARIGRDHVQPVLARRRVAR